MQTSSLTPIQQLTIRAHSVNKDCIIASYAFGHGRRFHTGSKVYEGCSSKAIKGCKLDILNEALMALGEGKRVNIEVEEQFLLDFLRFNTLKNEAYYQALVDDLRINLSLCSSVTCNTWVSRGVFNAALGEYKTARYNHLPASDPYKQIKMMAEKKKMKEAHQYEMEVTNW